MKAKLGIFLLVVCLLTPVGGSAYATHGGDANMDGYGLGVPVQDRYVYCEDWGTENVQFLCHESNTPGNPSDHEVWMGNVAFFGFSNAANDVAVWQAILWADNMGYNRCASSPPGNNNHIDGYFGQNTENSTLFWQAFFNVQNGETTGLVKNYTLSKADDLLFNTYVGAEYVGRSFRVEFLKSHTTGWNDYGLYLTDGSGQLRLFSTANTVLDSSIANLC